MDHSIENNFEQQWKIIRIVDSRIKRGKIKCHTQLTNTTIDKNEHNSLYFFRLF